MSGAVSLAVCAIFKDEARNLAEWLRFHRLVGVERFYLYDNDSSDGWRAAIADGGGSGDVTVIPAPGRARQVPAYGDCIERFGREARWIAFIDCDEFLFPTDGSDLRLLLEGYARHPALVVNWMMFGASGHDARPEGLVSRNYVRRGRTGVVVGHRSFLRAPGLDPSLSASYRPMNTHVKSIVQPARVAAAVSPHFFRYRDEAIAVNEEGDPVREYFSDYVSVARVRINHYWSKSRAELERKVARGYACAGGGVPDRYAEALLSMLDAETDTTVFPIACRLPGWGASPGPRPRPEQR